MNRVLLASLVGSSIEWFDYFLYGTVAALVFNQVFFVTEDPSVGLLLAYASFALAFFIRPFGGIIFSHIGDRIGRKKTLVVTLTLMGVATFGMGLLPTYQAIGIWAPILLITLRLVQGLGIGGEWGGALLLSCRICTKRKTWTLWKYTTNGNYNRNATWNNCTFDYDTTSRRFIYDMGMARSVHIKCIA